MADNKDNKESPVWEKEPKAWQSNDLTKRTIDTFTGPDANWDIKILKGLSTTAANNKSIAGMAKRNIFEFPVFYSKSVPLDYATAMNALLEQMYASYLQMAIANNPFIDRITLGKNGPFANFKTDTIKYLEYTDMFYAHDACHNKIETTDGVVFEFDMVSITDKEAEIINEAVNYQPLSEFAHFFQEAKDNKKDHKININYTPKTDDEIQNTFTAEDLIRKTNTTSTSKGSKRDHSISNSHEHSDSTSSETNRPHPTLNNGQNAQQQQGGRNAQQGATLKQGDTHSDKSGQVDTRGTGISNTSSSEEAIQHPSKYEIKSASVEFNTKLNTFRKEEAALIKALKENEGLDERLRNADKLTETQRKKLKKDKEKTQLEIDRLRQELNDDKEAITKLVREPNGETSSVELSYMNEILDKRYKLLMDKRLSVANYQMAVKDLNFAERRWRMEREKHAKDMMLRTAQYMDESKIQKLNTMKPTVMTVQMHVTDTENTVDNEGRPGRVSLSTPMEFALGVKMHARLVDPDILPEVVEFPIKQMNKLTRKVKWRAGEIKFLDYMFKTKAKKQTAVDSNDPRRKWYRRLYELAHKPGDSFVSNDITGNSSSGLIPNVTIVVSQSDVDNIKAQTNINMLKGSVAKKFCTELFLMAFAIVDLDAESIKIIQPNLHNDYEVHSLASLKKQLATLDTVGDKARDMFKLLGK